MPYYKLCAQLDFNAIGYNGMSQFTDKFRRRNGDYTRNKFCNTDGKVEISYSNHKAVFRQFLMSQVDINTNKVHRLHQQISRGRATPMQAK